MKHHFGLSSEIIAKYLQRLNMAYDSFDSVVVSGTQKWGFFHSDDISIKYGLTQAHAGFCGGTPLWAPGNYQFFDGVGSGFARYVEQKKLCASPAPVRVEWGPALRNLSLDFSAIADLAKNLDRAPPEIRNEIQSRFLLPLTLTIRNASKPGFFVDHHAAHAYYAGYYSGPKSIVVTHDGGGATAPFNSGGIYLFDKARGALPFASHRLTLGLIYDLVGRRFKIDPGKLMGLSSYAIPNRYIDAVVRQYVEGLYGQGPLPAEYVAHLIVESAAAEQILRRPAIAKFRFGLPLPPRKRTGGAKSRGCSCRQVSQQQALTNSVPRTQYL
jgi:hypothetical protein